MSDAERPTYKNAQELTMSQIRDLLTALDKESYAIRPHDSAYIEGAFREAARVTGSKETLSRKEAEKVLERAMRDSKDPLTREEVRKIAEALGLR